MTITTARRERRTVTIASPIANRRNRFVELAVAGILLGIATVGLIATTDAAFAAPVAPASVSNVQLPTE